jgi:tRNA threonylcarbamoyladenosine modification (KEOPS) complex  Pcc1 subunit
LGKAKAEAEVSVDFRTQADARAMARALLPEITATRTKRAHIRVVTHGKATKIVFQAGDLIALRAMVNSFLRFAAAWRRVSDAVDNSHRRAKRS